jgi:hypothetical protein
MNMTNILILSLSVYGVTLLLTQGHAFGWWRAIVRRTVGRLAPDYPVDTCRMCQGVWVTIAAAFLLGIGPLDAMAVYGLSYFLATQERIS